MVVVIESVTSACGDAYPPFSPNQSSKARAAADAFDPSVLSPLVERIVRARLEDPEKDETHGDLCRGQSRCVYTRAATAQLLRADLTAPALAGSTLREQRVIGSGVATTNLILDIPGRVRPAEWVLATAHYDAWFGGANDDASGVAVVLASALPLLNAKLDRSVRLVFFDGEELGMVGAGRYVAEYGTEGVTCVLNADSIAFVGEPGGVLTRQPAGTEYVLQTNAAGEAAAFAMADLARGLPRPLALLPLVFPDDGVSLVGVAVGYDLGDHAPFWLRGVPALFPFPAGDKPTWYHTERDLPAVVDRDRLERFGTLLVAALAAFATVNE